MASEQQQRPEDAVLAYIQSGAYPQSERTALAELLPSTCPSIRKGLDASRQKTKADISSLSRQAAPEVDGWIKQAQWLQQDLERSKAIARDVLEEAETATSLQGVREDFAQKSALLNEEVEFNTRLERILELAQEVAGLLAAGQVASAHGKLALALEKYEVSLANLSELQPFENSGPVELLTQRSRRLRFNLEDRISAQWDDLIKVDPADRRISIQSQNENGQGNVHTDLPSTVELVSRIGLFNTKQSKLCRDLERVILIPILERKNDRIFHVVVGENDISVTDALSTYNVRELLDDLTNLVNFLELKLPNTISLPLSETVMPPMVSRIVSGWLSTSIPTSLDELSVFEDLSARVSAFAEHLASIGWHGGAELNDWVEQGPKVWLSKRRETSLSLVRDVLSGRITETLSVERIETQMLDRHDVIASTNGMGDDWDAGWTNDEEPSDSVGAVGEDNTDDDLSAWDINQEERDQMTRSHIGEHAIEDSNGGQVEHEDEAWGWGDQDAQTHVETRENSITPAKPTSSRVNGSSTKIQQAATLKESYTVTAVPDELLSSITQLIKDASELHSPRYAKFRVASAGSALYSIPTLVLAGYRALAENFYYVIPGGNMYLYNDTVRLATELTKVSSNMESSDPEAFRRTKLTDDIAALSSFGKRAYGKEMEAQRTILRDLLDGAQGFTNCTEEPFASECENAIVMTKDRLLDVGKEWKPVLSQSAWLQSLGSLLNTVVNLIITDICDLSDISEEESKRLRKFCNQLGELSDLFTVVEAGGESRDRTALFTPNWIRFQYLGEILDSSLADIKYLWQEGELKLDYEATEIIDLIEALFADSDHRRRAIAEIRRS